MGSNKEVIFSVKNISKRFDSIQALNGVRFELLKGEVHALVGENGAGKSTLLNIMSGVYRRDEGEMVLDGVQVDFRSPLQAKRSGIIKVHQEMQLIPYITVAQNMFLGNEPMTKFHTVDFQKMEKRSDAMLEQLNASFKSTVITRELSTAQQQLVEIAKALLYDFNVLALDEPTASLTYKEVDELFNVIKNMKREGKSIIYISHRLDEVFEICDRVTVFRDGKYIDTADVKDVTKAELIKMMVGRDVGNVNYHSNILVTDNDDVLEIRNFSDGKYYKNINFTLKKGEILGLSGLVGAGRTELVRGIFGADPRKEGEIFVKGHKVSIQSPQDAIKNGIMLIPEDRKLQGFVGELSNQYNVALPHLNKYVRHKIIDFKYMAKQVKEITDKLNVHPSDNNLKTRQLSGGNQQKIVVAKALNVEPDILILDEPTRGIDVMAKHEIYQLIRSLADQGKSIIFISSELPEILSLSDRILIMYEGRLTGEISGRDATEDSVMQYAVGGQL